MWSVEMWIVVTFVALPKTSTTGKAIETFAKEISFYEMSMK